jgi:hypothetical protein
MFLVVSGIGYVYAPTLLSANTPIMVISLSSFLVLDSTEMGACASTNDSKISWSSFTNSSKLGGIVPQSTYFY